MAEGFVVLCLAVTEAGTFSSSVTIINLFF